MKVHLRIVTVLALAGVCVGVGAPAATSSSTVGTEVARRAPERSPAIVGGTVAAAGAWPWMARLDLMTPDGILFPALDGQPDLDQYCGGSLIGERWVLTAGHCTLLFGEVIGGPGFIPGITFHVVIGETPAHGVGNALSEFEVQPEDVIALRPAAGGGLSGDLALLRLPRPATNQALRIVGASNDSHVPHATGTPLIAIGWGLTAEDDPAGSEDLRQVEVPLVSDGDCAYAYPTVGYDFGYLIGFDAHTMVCAGSTGKDTCQGDSGGPLMAPDGAAGWVQIGITSWGEGCAKAGFPGVYGRLSGLYGFILSTLKADREAPAGLPEAATGAAVQVKKTTARLLGTVVPNGLATVYVIEYGTTRRYLGGRIQAYAGAGGEEAAVAAMVKGLKPNTIYHYRVSALNLAGAAEGVDRTFKTKPVPEPRNR